MAGSTAIVGIYPNHLEVELFHLSVFSTKLMRGSGDEWREVASGICDCDRTFLAEQLKTRLKGKD